MLEKSDQEEKQDAKKDSENIQKELNKSTLQSLAGMDTQETPEKDTKPVAVTEKTGAPTSSTTSKAHVKKSEEPPTSNAKVQLQTDSKALMNEAEEPKKESLPEVQASSPATPAEKKDSSDIPMSLSSNAASVIDEIQSEHPLITQP